MSKGINQIQGAELEKLKKEVESNADFNLVMDSLLKFNKITSKDYTVIKAGKSTAGDINVTYLVVGLNKDTIKVVYVKSGIKSEVFLSTTETENGKDVLKGYRVVNGTNLENVANVDFTETFKNTVKELDEKNFEMPDDNDTFRENLPCLYGNWCGPGCSGPSAPISPVDSCCKKHDNCYGSRGYFACSCDNELLGCLWPYVLQGSEWAITIYAYFANALCNPFA